ncbi:adenine phosphoribosyltransferase [Sphingobacterium sp. SYP-B4668]|uniref:adenine phosphoribosyltransferase n=1 Tax=Sphingobacterium sp. SYP-B4668 TaxID=2996035 RepID=UPI0022DE4587|nr:adenine phosphoribosyltransferase [Sphingobacterium sp. SYP-B4668]
MIEQRLMEVIRDIEDFPKPGIVFKDITPILKDASLCNEVVDAFALELQGLHIDAIAGIESRGFLFGLMLANKLNLPFIPIRKQGKLPYRTISESYALEYGQATIEIHEDAFESGQHILIHDDLLATGGTVVAASKLIEKLGGRVAGFSFVITLDFLQSRGRLTRFSDNIVSLVSYV